jgi:hypothetical protein
MTFSFRPAMVAPILPHAVAEKVPFGDLPDLLATFDIAPSSAEAATVADTLSQCQALPIDGEHKACATSLESTVQSAMRMLGTAGTDDDDSATTLWAAASALPSTGLPLQPYVIQAVTTLDGDRHVGCHIMPYPYAVYFCHMTPAMPTKVYLVSLRSSISGGGPAVTMAAICHLDTSNWQKAHPAFEMVHTQPGGVPVCHFMSYGNLLFGEKAVAATR